MASFIDLLTKGPSMLALSDIMEGNAKAKAAKLSKKQVQAQLDAALEALKKYQTAAPTTAGGPTQVLQYVRGSDGLMYPVLSSTTQPIQNTPTGPFLPITPPTGPIQTTYQNSPGVLDPYGPVPANDNPLSFIDGIDPMYLALGGAGILGVVFLTRKKGRR